MWMCMCRLSLPDGENREGGGGGSLMQLTSMFPHLNMACRPMTSKQRDD